MRLTTGMQAPLFEATTLGGAHISLGSLRGRVLLLKFYRFATCPVCNLHLHRFTEQYASIAAAGLKTVVFFHSPNTKVAATRKEPAPFDLVADPDKTMFRLYGVETGWRGMVSPAVMRDYVRALRAGYEPGMFTSDGGMLGNPADFMVDEDGRILLARYGTHYADSLTAREVLQSLHTLRSAVATGAYGQDAGVRTDAAPRSPCSMAAVAQHRLDELSSGGINRPTS